MRLSLRSARDVNTSSMMKVGWIICSHPTYLWVQVVRSKYKCGSQLIPVISKPKIASNFWHGVCKAQIHVKFAITWHFGNGEKIRFWKDHWLQNLPSLESLLMKPLDTAESEKLAVAYIRDDGEWDRDFLALYLSTHILSRLDIVGLKTMSLIPWLGGCPQVVLSHSNKLISISKNHSLILPIFPSPLYRVRKDRRK